MRTQTKNYDLIKFRAQYSHLIEEMIDDAFFVKKQFNKVCFIDNNIFSDNSIKLLKKAFGDIDIINVKNIDNAVNIKYDLIIAPYILQFLPNLKSSIVSLSDMLEGDGALFTSGFNILGVNESIIPFKKYIVKNEMRPQMVSFFDFGKLLNLYPFTDKALDREKLIILGNTVEIINVFCVKKASKIESNSIKIEIL